MEVKRYSSASEDSGRGDGDEEEEAELDRLAALSVESLASHQPYAVSTCRFGDGDSRSDGWADSDNVDGEEEADGEGDRPNPAPYMNLLPDRRGDNEEDDDDEDGLVDGTDIRHGVGIRMETRPLMVEHVDCERTLRNNAASRPWVMGHTDVPPPRTPSLTDLTFPGQGDEDSSSSSTHASVPCLTVRAGAARPVPVDKDSAVNSLPNLNPAQCNGHGVSSCVDSAEQLPSVKRHASDGRVCFSPFRFTDSDC